jgi:hypothetical protein
MNLDRAHIAQRQDGYLVNHYMGLHVTIVSVALGIAGVAAASLLTARQLPLEHRLLFGSLWVASMLATAVAYAGTTSGSFALPPHIPAMWDLLIPLFIAVAEFLLFAVLVSQVTDAPEPRTVVVVWFFCFSAFALLSSIAVARARYLFKATAYGGDIAPDVARYVGRLNQDIASAGTVGAIAFAGGVVQLCYARLALAQACGFSIVVIVAMIGALAGQGRTAKEWRRALS